jgi:hypothetical protein
MKSAQCDHDELSQPRGSTYQKLQVCQSSLSQPRGSPHWNVPMVCLIPDKADSLVTNKGRLGRIRSLVVLAAFSMHRETG